MKGLYAMAGREMTRRREELRARPPELYESALWRMPSANLVRCPYSRSKGVTSPTGA